MDTETSRTLLIVDDDVPLAQRLARAMEQRGFAPVIHHSLHDIRRALPDLQADYALIDLRLGDGHGLDVVELLHTHCPHCRIVMMTAYGNIATAVAAVKAGALDYLAKPLDADTAEAALLANEAGQAYKPALPQTPMTAERVRWEHILRIYEQCDRNVSETARQLSMHRRTLQRILAKYAPRDNAA